MQRAQQPSGGGLLGNLLFGRQGVMGMFPQQIQQSGIVGSLVNGLGGALKGAPGDRGSSTGGPRGILGQLFSGGKYNSRERSAAMCIALASVVWTQKGILPCLLMHQRPQAACLLTPSVANAPPLCAEHSSACWRAAMAQPFCIFPRVGVGSWNQTSKRG
jgi:hypothetical protein